MAKIKNGLSDLIEIWMAACFKRAMRKSDDGHKSNQRQRQAKLKLKQPTKSRQP